MIEWILYIYSNLLRSIAISRAANTEATDSPAMIALFQEQLQWRVSIRVGPEFMCMEGPAWYISWDCMEDWKFDTSETPLENGTSAWEKLNKMLGNRSNTEAISAKSKFSRNLYKVQTNIL